FALALVICSSILLRWLLLAKRNLARQQAMARRAALQAEAAQQAGDDEADSTTTESLPSIEQEMVNITAVSEQSRQLLRFTIGITAAIGIFAIWGHVLPALGMLDQWKVYEVAIEPTTTS